MSTREGCVSFFSSHLGPRVTFSDDSANSTSIMLTIKITLIYSVMVGMMFLMMVLMVTGCACLGVCERVCKYPH